MFILASIAIPRFVDILPRVKVQADAQQIAWVLRIARQDTVTSGISKPVLFYTKANKYTYMDKVYELSPEVNYLGDTTFKTNYAGRTACIFLPNGTVSGGGTITLKCENRKKYIIVLHTTGRIRVSDKPPEEGSE